MGDPRAFLSFDFDHDELSRTLFAGQGKQKSPTAYSISDWSSKSALPQAVWQSAVLRKISQCNLMVVLVGRHMGSASGVVKEIGMATSQRVPYFGIYVDGADSSSTLPTGLAGGRVMTWTWTNVGNAIKQMMTEGKNRQ